MACDTMNLYLDNVAAFIHDDDKLVTYKWLSKELEIHVNIAKRILEKYWENHRNDIEATFLLKGELEDGSLRLEVVRELNLSSAKNKFKRLDFEHIYSLQKSLPDLELLASAGEGDVRFSAIKFAKNVLRKEIEKNTVENVTKVEKENLPRIEKVENKKEEKVEKIEKETKVEKTEKETKVENIKEENVGKKVKSTEEDAIKGAAKGKSSTKTNKKPVQSTKAGFNNLFGKVPNQPKPVSKSETVKEKDSETEIVEEKKVENSKKTVVKKKSPSPVKISKAKLEKEKKTSQQKQTQKKKRDRSAETLDSSKKRKRIILASDSSEDEEMSHHSEEEPEEIIEEPKFKKRKSPTPPPVKTKEGKIKIRKMVSQTVQDEDGYFLTRQVPVFEEIDVELEPEPVQRKPDPPKVKKQTSLMSFFKKT